MLSRFDFALHAIPRRVWRAWIWYFLIMVTNTDCKHPVAWKVYKEQPFHILQNYLCTKFVNNIYRQYIQHLYRKQFREAWKSLRLAMSSYQEKKRESMKFSFFPMGSGKKSKISLITFAKDCLLTLVKSRLALGSPGCLFGRSFVTMPKMAQYTEKWLLTAP